MNESELSPEATYVAEDAVHAVKNAAQAIETDRAEQMKLLKSATLQSFEEALRKVFGENLNSGRFDDINQIPFICRDIQGIREDIGEIKASMISKLEFWPVKTLVYGMVGLMLTGIIGALMIMLLK